MNDVDELNFRKWAGLTQQQYDIVKIIYRLRARGTQPTPKMMQREYRAEFDKYLMKPNLFNVLRILQQRKIIHKVGQADYQLDYEGIKNTLETAKEKIQNDAKELENTTNKVDQFFREITYRKETPDIQHLESQTLTTALAEAVDKSTTYHAMTDFPTTAYSREMQHATNLEEYADALWRALKGKKTKINLLTTLNTDTLFNHALKTYGNPKTAYQESQRAIDKLQTQAETHKNLDIRITDTQQGLDIAIAQKQDPTEFIILTRNEHDQINGGIRIKSHKTSTVS